MPSTASIAAAATSSAPGAMPPGCSRLPALVCVGYYGGIRISLRGGIAVSAGGGAFGPADNNGRLTACLSLPTARLRGGR